MNKLIIFISIVVPTVYFITISNPQVEAETSINLESVIEDINKYRLSQGLNELAFNPKLQTSACTKGQRIVDSGTFTHTPNDTNWSMDIDKKFTKRGENLAQNFTDYNLLVPAWINSPAHNKVLLGDFDYVGMCEINNVIVLHVGRF